MKQMSLNEAKLNIRVDELEKEFKTLRKIVQDLRMDIDILKSKKKDKGNDKDEEVTLPPELRHKKLCPFCGGKRIEFEQYDENHKGLVKVTIACRDCGANFDIISSYETDDINDAKDMLIDAWNKRIYK